MSDLTVTIAGRPFEATLEEELAPVTCEAFRRLLPYSQKAIHVRWSGEAVWIPMGDMNPDLPPEQATRHPAPGCVIWYPGGLSETEILIAYGGTSFSSIAGPLAGNHFLTIHEPDGLREIGRRTLWEGAQEITFTDGSSR